MAVSGLLGRKIGMTSVFGEGGQVNPVTVLEVGPCTVVQVRTKERDGYEAAQLAFGALPPRTRKGREGGNLPRGSAGHRGRAELARPLRRHFETAGVEPHKYLREFAISEGTVAVGDKFSVDLFKVGARVKVRATSKGKGFQGVMKRHHFKGQKASHGQKIHRKPASQGATDAARVFKGSRRPGRMGNKMTTVANLSIVNVIPERNLLLLKGAVPGPTGALIRVERH